VRGEEEPHSVADLQVRDVRADRIDHTGAILVRNELLIDERFATRARLPVGRIHT